MGRKVYTPEQIIGKLREAEVLLGQRHTVGQVRNQKEMITNDTPLHTSPPLNNPHDDT